MIPGDVVHQKDNQLIENMNVLGNVIHRMEESQKKNQLKARNVPSLYASDMDALKPQEGRILLNELTKVLKLNNDNPKKYNLEYWARYFNIQPQQLKNIFNYISFPVIDEEEIEIAKVLRFIEIRE